MKGTRVTVVEMMRKGEMLETALKESHNELSLMSDSRERGASRGIQGIWSEHWKKIVIDWMRKNMASVWEEDIRSSMLAISGSWCL